MIERIFENWLTSASERSFQLAFVQLLIAEGHEIIHVSTHGAGEHGKDIISKDSEGKYHAYQLKVTDVKDLSKAEWRKMRDEVYEVSEVRIEHPSVPPGVEHTGWFVINSGLTPDVFAEIEMRNRESVEKGRRGLKTALKGEVCTRLLKEFKSLLPEEPKDFQQFLSLYLANGQSPLDKEKFAKLIASTLPETEETSKKEPPRRISGATLLALYALHPYLQEKNWVAIIDGLVIVAASTLRWSALRKLPDAMWQSGFAILMDTLDAMFSDLQQEVLTREEVLVQGNILVDQPYYAYRITKLLGYIAGWQVFRFLRTGAVCDGKGIEHILLMKDSKPLLWGEAAIPQLLALEWFRECSLRQPSDTLLNLLGAVVSENQIGSGNYLPSPYYSETQVLEVNLRFAPPFSESFTGRSFSLRSLVDVMVRREQRETLEKMWKQLSHIQCVEFKPIDSHDYLAWKVEERGKEDTRIFEAPQSWAALIKQSDRSDEAPPILNKSAYFLPLFLIVYPHRFCPPLVAKADDAILRKIISDGI